MEGYMVKEFILGAMVESTKGNIIMIRNKVMEFIIGETVEGIKGNG